MQASTPGQLWSAMPPTASNSPSSAPRRPEDLVFENGGDLDGASAGGASTGRGRSPIKADIFALDTDARSNALSGMVEPTEMVGAAPVRRPAIPRSSLPSAPGDWGIAAFGGRVQGISRFSG